jgi:hypothetical protein
MSKDTQAARERRIDAALEEGRYRVASRCRVGEGTERVGLWFCDIIEGRCKVCLSEKPGGKNCFSMTVVCSEERASELQEHQRADDLVD